MKNFDNYNLKNLNTFGIEAFADKLIHVESYEDLKVIFDGGMFDSTYMILGGGSDILFTENYKGTIIKIDLKGKQILEDTENFSRVESFAGEDWDELVEFCVQNNIGGMENLSLIPGNVGASPVQNIGAYGIEAKDIVESVEFFNVKTGTFETYNNEQCKFNYRTSIFKEELKGSAIVTKVIFNLTKPHQLITSYPDVILEMEKINVKVEDLTIRQLRDMICEVRKRKLPQPEEEGNAGSFFRNPIVNKEHYKKLLAQYSEIKSYPVDEVNVKLSAGWLIETAGWKGWTSDDGTYGVSKKHSLVLVNHGNANGKLIKELSEKIKSDIKQKFGVDLVEEVILV